MFAGRGAVRPHARALYDRLLELAPEELARRHSAASLAFLQLGITFTVYSEEAGIERIFPFDIIPRVIDYQEWRVIEEGLKQRLRALNLFLSDVYGAKRIFRDKVLPAALVLAGDGYRQLCEGWSPPNDVWFHISGIDLVRDKDGQYYVLEDNLRTPSGVSYVLANRNVLKRVFPKVFSAGRVLPVDDYPARLLETLSQMAPAGVDEPTVVVLTPGIYNAAYYEHSFLAREMGVQLVEGSDLICDGGFIKMRTTRGFQRVDVIYRRIDDDFLDPLAFRPDSALGVPGLWEACRAGRVSLANAVGCGVADDKVIYAYVPKMIRYYLSEEPILPSVPTYVCHEEEDRKYVLEHLESLVVKAANQSGGYGMLMGPRSSAAEREAFRDKILANPRGFVAQPVLSLSRVPTIVGDKFEGRHVDLRPYVLCGRERIFVLPGGLTRVALKEGSLVVNSSQGGGSKDTWVVTGSRNGEEQRPGRAGGGV
ncbi:circularly permuted type 2 ATP-grasp protein [Candidatus Poribacteria bacterium]|nr:circularly permuted type 2 ATP-grasp protein [Candidatus Poribacteria bacterium]